MPTIDELAPATAASDADLLPADQAGITRKVTRAQIVSGLQPEFVLPPGALVGRSSSGIGAAETIAVGANLILNGGTLAAASGETLISSLPAGAVPGNFDVVPLGQNGSNVAVTYSQFIAGLPEVSGLDISGTTLVPGTGAAAQRLSAWASGVLLQSGGSVSGNLAISGSVTVGSSLSVAGTLSATGMIVSSTASVSGNFAVGGNILASGSVLAQSGLNVAGGLAIVPVYRVSALPPAVIGAVAYANDGRKPGEAAGAGTGMLVWGSGGGQWFSAATGTPVQS